MSEKNLNDPENINLNSYNKEQKINVEDLLKLKDECLENIKNEKDYYIRNDAKLRAIYNTESYEEFKDIVDAAHLKPLSKKDKKNVTTKSRLWNSAAKEN